MKTHYWVVRLRRADANNAARYLGGRNERGWADGVLLRHAFRWGGRFNAMRAAIAMGGVVVRVRRRAAPKCGHRNVSALIEWADTVLAEWVALGKLGFAGDGEYVEAIGRMNRAIDALRAAVTEAAR